jgi:hypothetical protein
MDGMHRLSSLRRAAGPRLIRIAALAVPLLVAACTNGGASGPGY